MAQPPPAYYFELPVAVQVPMVIGAHIRSIGGICSIGSIGICSIGSVGRIVAGISVRWICVALVIGIRVASIIAAIAAVIRCRKRATD